MKERKYVDGKLMRYGYTTGSCAAAAAKAAALYILEGVPPRTVVLTTPKGKVLNLLVEKTEMVSDGAFPLRAKCAIRKDAGDDPDVTHGALIVSEVTIDYRIIGETRSGGSGCDVREDSPYECCSPSERIPPTREELLDFLEDVLGNNAKRTNAEVRDADISEISDGIEIEIDGGEGIGRVTKPGLDQPVGAAAINSGPRAMIRRAVTEAIIEVLGAAREDISKVDEKTRNVDETGETTTNTCERSIAADGGRAGLCFDITDHISGMTPNRGWSVKVIVSAPEGKLLGKRTFNPMMGIEGGISILGTTGIVEPMSDQALAATIEAEVSVIAAAGHKKLMINLGNYGENYTTKFLGLGTEPSVKCANFIGTAVDAAVAEGLDKILLIGHIGKLVKLGISMFNTHSNNGDGRLETLAACAVEAGLDIGLVREILACATTEAAVDVLDGARSLTPVLERLKDRIERSIGRHIPDSVQMEFICFSGKIGQWRPLFQSAGAEEMSTLWKS